jgi:hypothetical protein
MEPSENDQKSPLSIRTERSGPHPIYDRPPFVGRFTYRDEGQAFDALLIERSKE